MGKKATFFITALMAGFFVFVLSDCKKQQNKGFESTALKAAGGGSLKVLTVTPLGRTALPHESQSIVAIFDRPMVALEALPEGRIVPVFRLDPSFAGKTRWLGSRTLTFSPDARFPYATQIKVTIPAGTKALDGSILGEDYTWSFQTATPELVRHFPEDQQKWLGPETQVLLVFNQAVDMDSAKDSIFVRTVEQGREINVDIRLASPSAERLKEESLDISPSQAFILMPREKLKPDLTYTVEVRPGLASKEGPLRLEKGYAFRFETYRSFRFAGLERTKDLNPAEQLGFRFSNQVVYRDFVKNIRFDPPLEIPSYYSEWDYGSDVLWLSLPLQPETGYKAKISQDLKDEFGNTLGAPVEIQFSTASYPPSLSMTTGFGILEAYAEPKYPVSVLNMDSVIFQAASVKKEEVVPLLLKPKIFWSDEQFLPPKGFFQVEKTVDFRLPRNTRQVVPLDLQEVLPGQYGLVFLQLDTKRPEDKWQRYPKVFLQATGLGISGKFSPDNNLIWVTELRTGLPVPEAEVEIRDDLNRVKWKGKTDKEGRAQSPGWRILGITSQDPWSEPRQWVFAGRGPDLAFSSSDWGTGIDPYRFRIPYEWSPQPIAVQGSLFTERGIYRAGEDVHVKGIIRRAEKGQWVLPSSREAECEIRDPFQKSVFKDKVALDEFGSLAFDFASAEDASLGFYQITASILPERPGEKPSSLYGSFRIEAFRPAEFEVHLRTVQEGAVFGQDYGAEIRANYLFGGAMTGQSVAWHLRLNRTSFSPPGFKGYVFGNELEWGEDETEEISRLAASGEGLLDAAGKLQVRLPLRPEKEKDSVSAILEATVVSPSRRSISNRIQTIIHRGEYYIGLKPSTSFLQKGETLNVEVIASNPQGKTVPEKKIGLKLIRRQWRSVRKAGVGGRFRWITEKEDTEIARQDIRTKNEAVSVSLLPDKTGFYFLLGSGTDGLGNTITTTTYFYVTGKDYVAWERSDDDALELVADADQYRPGDTARILVKSPYEKAKALLTIEREFIIESRVLEIEGTSSQVEIPVRADYMPNVFISVLLIQGRKGEAKAEESQDVGKPSFKIGYINLPVDPAEKRLSITIQKDKDKFKPKETVTLRFKVTNQKDKGCPAALTVAVVDIGVLNLIGYQTPDPFAQFYGERPLSVRTSETRIHVIGQRDYGEKGEEVGGGAAAEAAPMQAALSEVELRGDFKSTAYWNPSLKTDDQGVAQVSFTLPDNLTTFRIMAVAQTKESQFGRSEADFRVSKELLLQSALPRFARVGDTFQGGVVVHNLSSAKGTVVLNAQTSGLLFTDKRAERSISLAPGESQEVLFALEAAEPGLASFAFRARMGKETDGLETKIPIRLPRPLETVALFGETRESAEEKISVPGSVFPEESTVEVQAGSSALLGLKGSLDDLTGYPYLCLEQRLSAVLPYLLAPQVILDFGISSMSREDMVKYVKKQLRELSSYQKDSGGFGLWPDSPIESPYLTCYTAFALIKAAELGYSADRQQLESALAFLKNLLREDWRADKYPFSLRDWKTTKAFALYVLALVKQPEPAFADRLLTERDDLSLFGKTLLLKALHYGKGSPQAEEMLLQELLNKIKVTASSAHFEEGDVNEGRWIYSSNTRTTAFMLQSLIEIGRDHPLLAPLARWLVEKQQSGNWLSTQDHLYVFYALNEYYRKYENVRADYRGKVILAGKSLLDEIFRASEPRMKRAKIKLSELAANARQELTLRVEKSGEGVLYYGARLNYAPRERSIPRDEGLAIMKRIESLEGKVLDTIPPGSLVVVTVEVAVPQECLFVVVDDPLPAGLEAVNPHFITESEEHQRRLEDMSRLDARPWWQGFNHVEMRDDRVLLFADSLTAGVHTYRYLARALSFGRFLIPGTRAEQMYAPEVFGRSVEKQVQVGR